MRALLFLLFPALELYLLVKAGDVFGASGVVAEVFLSAALGVAVMRRQGRQTLAGVQNDLQAGRMPQDILLDNLLVFFAGILLIVPGFISDALGLLLLIPPLRTLFRLRLVAWLSRKQASGGFRSGTMFVYRSGSTQERQQEEGGEVIDVGPESVDDTDSTQTTEQSTDQDPPTFDASAETSTDTSTDASTQEDSRKGPHS